MSSYSYPGRAVLREDDSSRYKDNKTDGDSLLELSKSLTTGLRALLQENKELKERLLELEQKYRDSSGAIK